MSHQASKASVGALAAAAMFISANPAFSHVIVGSRFFPATLTFDDPGPNDELGLPTFTHMTNADGSQQYDFSGEWQKTITPDFAISIGNTFTHLTNPTANGWQNFETQFKYVPYMNEEHEFIVSIGTGIEWGHTGNASVGADPYTRLTPEFWFGKGFGDLPTSLNVLRPFAVTGNLGASFSTHPIDVTVAVNPDTGFNAVNIANNPTFFNWSLSLQYSLPYMNANVSAIDVEFFRHLIPLVEVNFQSPVANIGPSVIGAPTHITTGTVNPGVIWAGRFFQVAVEAMIPVNSASGKHVGVIAGLDIYLDDLLPDSLGRPLFAPAGYQSARSPFGPAQSAQGGVLPY